MSKLQELIQKLCPDGVEYKKLGELGKRLKGLPITATQMKAMASSGGEIRIFAGGKTKVDTHLAKIPKANIITDPAVLVQSRGVIDFIYYDKPFTFKNEMWAYTMGNNVSVKFLYYYLKSNVETFRRKATAMGTFPQISIPDTENFLIPIPPLEVQEEIVRILDNFTNLAAELQAELQARQEQYEYYRNKLLTFNNVDRGGYASVTWMKMSEIGTFVRGKRFVRTDIVNDGVPCIHYGDMYTYYGLYATQSKGRLKNELASKMRYAQKNDVVIVAAGENKEDIGIGLAWLGDEAAAVHDACFIFRSDLYPQYVSHYLRSNYYHKQIVKYVSEGKICSISAKSLGNAIIPVPPYEEQVRIATLLNNFDALVGDLTEGLPAEMAAVQEQYEYYRNKLLSFPRTKISA